MNILKRLCLVVWAFALIFSMPAMCALESPNRASSMCSVIIIGIAFAPLVYWLVRWIITGEET